MGPQVQGVKVNLSRVLSDGTLHAFCALHRQQPRELSPAPFNHFVPEPPGPLNTNENENHSQYQCLGIGRRGDRPPVRNLRLVVLIVGQFLERLDVPG
jgi:hypothetical protein